MDKYQYFLVITDERDTAKKEATGDSNVYARHDTTLVFAIRDAELVFADIGIFLANAPYKTTLKGTIKGIGLGMDKFAVIPEAVVNFQSVTDGSVPYSIKTKSDGTFTIENCIVQEYIITIDATNVKVTTTMSGSTTETTVAKAFIVENERLKLQIDDEKEKTDATTGITSKYIQLPTFFLMEQQDYDDLRMVVQWTAPSATGSPAYNLDAVFSIGR